MYKISDEVIKFIEETIKNWSVFLSNLHINDNEYIHQDYYSIIYIYIYMCTYIYLELLWIPMNRTPLEATIFDQITTWFD